MDQGWPVNSNDMLNGQARNAQQPQSAVTVPHDHEGDFAMEDAADLDPLKAKYNFAPTGNVNEDSTHSSDYPARSNHRSRPSSQYIPQPQTEESSAARRYSPMKLSVTPNNTGTPQYTSYTPAAQVTSSRPSPTRPSLYTSHSQQYYSSPPLRAQTQHLPPLQSNMSPELSYYPPRSATQQFNAVFGREQPMSPTGPQISPPQVPRGQVPRFTRCSNVADLRPHVNAQPPFRRANPEGGFISPLQALTTYLPATYRICNPSFKYESSRNPRRVLTKPSKGTKNDGYDNEDSDYILYVNDILGSENAGHKSRYLILDVLGQGTFGQVVKCQSLKNQEVVAVKVVKNRTAYFNQSMMEVSVLDLLNSKLDKNDDHHLLRLKDTFIHKQHLCLVFELLSVNLYELIKQNQFRGLSTTLVRVFAQQLLNALTLLSKARIIHCDLKPENILLKNLESPIIKIIDFGSACDERQTVYTYIQSRFYRSPEVLLGLPYSAAIDMWSLGCIVVELFLGLPLFPGSSEYNQVSRIVEMLGLPPQWMLDMGKQSGEFFEKTQDEFGRRNFRLKSMEQYSRERNTKEQPSKKYFQPTTLPEIIRTYPLPRKNMKQGEIDRELANRASFVDFVQGLLNLNPLERWTPQQAKMHPFITQQKFTGHFVPPTTLKASSSRHSPSPGVQQQQQAEALSKQKAQAQQAAQMQAQTASAMQAMQMGQYHQGPPMQNPPMYNAMYTPNPQIAPPPYVGQLGYGQQMQPMLQPLPPQQMQAAHYSHQQASLHEQATQRAGRQRASTMDQQQSGIPPALQRVVSHLDPNAPIRLQPSPAYYPPPADGAPDANTPESARRRGSRATNYGSNGRGNRDFIRTLEDRSVEEGYQPWQH